MEIIVEQVREICTKAKAAFPSLASASDKMRNTALSRIAQKLRESAMAILTANQKDLEQAEKNGLPKAMMDRLRLTEERIDGIASAVEELVRLDSPLGKGERWTRPNGLEITCIRVPMGVVGMIIALPATSLILSYYRRFLRKHDAEVNQAPIEIQ